MTQTTQSESALKEDRGIPFGTANLGTTSWLAGWQLGGVIRTENAGHAQLQMRYSRTATAFDSAELLAMHGG
jgi:hypothetical protein